MFVEGAWYSLDMNFMTFIKEILLIFQLLLGKLSEKQDDIKFNESRNVDKI